MNALSFDLKQAQAGSGPRPGVNSSFRRFMALAPLGTVPNSLPRLPVSALWLLMTVVLGVLTPSAWAGGSGLNTVVVINQASSNSCELGNYYCERRQVPPENVLRVNWTGGNIAWSRDEFQTNLAGPMLGMLAARGLSNQIDYVVLSMDIPIQTVHGPTINSTTSALFYGPKNDSGLGWLEITNSYAASEASFREAPPASAPGYSFLTTMITARTLDQAKALVDQGVAGDGTFPGREVLLVKSSDPTRNIRYHQFDNAIFNSRLGWNYSMQRTNTDSLFGQTNLLGLETGMFQFTISPNAFVPGAMADSLTSYGGLIFGPNDHTTLLAFIGAGAAGSYGTVVEPSPSPDKFPDPQNYFYQARGFSLAECYYQSLVAPYEGLIVGEPLSAPYRKPGTGAWITTNAVLRGTVQLALQLSAADRDHPIQKVDLFSDGKFLRSLTNIPPAAGNSLTVSLNGFPVSYAVPSNATLGSVTAGLAAALNQPANTNATQVIAIPHGDRIELRSTLTNRLAGSFYFTDAGATNSAPRFYRVVYLSESGMPSLTPRGFDPATGFRLGASSPASVPCVLQASTNLVTWIALLTNASGATLDFVDAAATNFSRRFYRLVATVSENRPRLSPRGRSSGGGFLVHVEGSGLGYILQASTNFTAWSALATNLAGGTLDFEDLGAANFKRRFYRALVLTPPAPPAATVTVLGKPGQVPSRVRIDGAGRPYRLEVSSDLINWTPIFTNLAVGVVQANATQSAGGAAGIYTRLSPRRSSFLDSIAYGTRSFTVNGTLQAGTFLQLIATKTNGARVTLTATSPSSSTTPAQLTQMLVNAINTSPDLQGDGGLVVEDLAAGWAGTAGFNVRARGAGFDAAAMQVRLTGSSSLVISPDTDVRLDANLGDLQPRNHLYVTAGVTNLVLTVPLDTTVLGDGFHELTAVASEGTQVRTQTRLTLPISITNSLLSARLIRSNLPDIAPVQGTYFVQVIANTNNASAIRLFSTGGQLGVVTNRPTANFVLNGADLGAGLHPLYAIIETADGRTYRTQKQFVRLVNGP